MVYCLNVDSPIVLLYLSSPDVDSDTVQTGFRVTIKTIKFQVLWHQYGHLTMKTVDIEYNGGRFKSFQTAVHVCPLSVVLAAECSFAGELALSSSCGRVRVGRCFSVSFQLPSLFSPAAN